MVEADHIRSEEDTTTAQGTDAALADGVAREFLIHHRVCPAGIRADGSVVVAVEPSSLLNALDDLQVAYGRPVAIEMRSAHEVELLIARVTSPLETAGLGPVDEDWIDTSLASDIRDLANQPPVVRYVNLLLRDAFDANASDVHLESTRHGLKTRWRLDGVLLPALEPPPRLDAAVISRVKLLADLDIAERRRPQDGRIRMHLEDRDLDVRVSTVPSMRGESVVLRLLERGHHAVALSDLGMPEVECATVERLARRPQGMLLSTGPTGSGKTTTLYAALRLREASREKIITVEDPVEYAVDGVTQVPVQRQAGVTFASMLRSILRQDPDVLMIGEMRDTETAELAVQAALTGHFVLSTLHTNDALGAVPRLIDLGIPPYLVSATLDAVLAQRLVRRTCDSCRETYVPDAPMPAALANVPHTRGRGCPACRDTGYRGRTGIFELVILTPEIRNAIATGAPADHLEDLANESGRVPLIEDGWRKIRAGITTIEEVLRVTKAEA